MNLNELKKEAKELAEKVRIPIYCINDSLGSDYEKQFRNQAEEADFIVYFYENEGYEGSGTVIACMKDGTFKAGSLSHCSCNSPFDDGYTSKYDSFEEIKDSNPWFFKWLLEHNEE